MNTATVPASASSTITVNVVTDQNPYHHHHRRSRTHEMIMIGFALVVFIFVIQKLGARLRNDWTPQGMAVKAILFFTGLSLVYYPYQLFMRGQVRSTRRGAPPGAGATPVLAPIS